MTDYKLVSGSRDYEKARKFYASEGMEHGKLSFPTVLALEEDEVIGALSTRAKDKKRGLIVAGPLAVRWDRPRFMTVIRLVDAYDNVMRAAGVASYIHFVERNNEKWLDFVRRTEQGEPYAETADHIFFLKRL